MSSYKLLIEKAFPIQDYWRKQRYPRFGDLVFCRSSGIEAVVLSSFEDYIKVITENEEIMELHKYSLCWKPTAGQLLEHFPFEGDLTLSLLKGYQNNPERINKEILSLIMEKRYSLIWNERKKLWINKKEG